MKIEHYVEYLYPGSLLPEESVIKIDAPADLKVALKYLQPGCFAFSFFSLRIREAEVEGKKIRDAERFDVSARWYPDADVFTLDSVRDMGPEFQILSGNMECNGWPRVVRTRRGNWQPFLDADRLILTATAPQQAPNPVLPSSPNKKESV